MCPICSWLHPTVLACSMSTYVLHDDDMKNIAQTINWGINQYLTEAEGHGSSVNP